MTVGFTKVLNIYVDIAMRYLTDAAFKILICIVRRTEGWHKLEACISLTQLQADTGKSRTTVLRGLNELDGCRLIRVGKITKNGKAYCLNTFKTEDELIKVLENYRSANTSIKEKQDSLKFVPVQKADKASKINRLAPVKKLDINKDITDIKDYKNIKTSNFLEVLVLPSNVDQNLWNDFVSMRNEIGQPLILTSAKYTLLKLESFGDQANESLIRAIEGGYPNVISIRKNPYVSNVKQSQNWIF